MQAALLALGGTTALATLALARALGLRDAGSLVGPIARRLGLKAARPA
ncbi:MAG TPA: hypothetical protein VNF72_15090 [Myxococcota bacterium]|nr:hypothetical protein [Myxococcota bacterium]